MHMRRTCVRVPQLEKQDKEDVSLVGTLVDLAVFRQPASLCNTLSAKPGNKHLQGWSSDIQAADYNMSLKCPVCL